MSRMSLVRRRTGVGLQGWSRQIRIMLWQGGDISISHVAASWSGCPCCHKPESSETISTLGGDLWIHSSLDEGEGIFSQVLALPVKFTPPRKSLPVYETFKILLSGIFSGSPVCRQESGEACCGLWTLSVS